MEFKDIDSKSIIGEECHIIARELNGPRGNYKLETKDRDRYPNLILLCRNHHKIIDDQVTLFTVESLRQIKLQHEEWVKKSLTEKQRLKSPLFFVYRVDTGIQLCRMFGCHAFHLDNDQPETEEAAELLGNFAQLIQDYGDIWGDIPYKERLLAQFTLQELIEEINSIGYVIYGAQQQHRLMFQDFKKPFNMTFVYVLIKSKNNPLVERKDEAIEKIMEVDSQTQSDFTNFIAVMRDSSSFQFI